MIEIIPKGYLNSSLNLCSPYRGLREAAGQALAFAQAKRRAKA